MEGQLEGGEDWERGKKSAVDVTTVPMTYGARIHQRRVEIIVNPGLHQHDTPQDPFFSHSHLTL